MQCVHFREGFGVMMSVFDAIWMRLWQRGTAFEAGGIAAGVCLMAL